jgi:sec-independent protein translocase protein TatC
VARARAVRFDDRLTLVEHLDELRTRIIISLAAFGVGFALCFWQDALMLDIFNSALPGDTGRPITLGVTEPFFTTVEVAAYGAFVLSLPVILYQAYAFVLPAFSDSERKVVLPFLLAAPLLFLAGVAFSYFIVLPAAIKFLLNFNAADFNIEVRARDYYRFIGVLCLSLGVLFQIPLGVLAITRLGIVTPAQLAHNRRYVIFGISVVAAALPGGDPVSMLLIMLPLILLYEASILLARRFGEPRERELGSAEPAAGESG